MTSYVIDLPVVPRTEAGSPDHPVGFPALWVR